MSDDPASEGGRAHGRRVFVGFGSNVDDAPVRLAAALAGLQAAGVRVAAVARPVRSPYEGPDGRPVPGVPAVLDTVVEARTDLDARALLGVLGRLEDEAGRDRTDETMRTLDLDLLDAGVELADDDLVLPHPRALARAFVLAPWEEIAPHHVVTGTGRRVLHHAAVLRARRRDAFERLAPTGVLPWPDLGATVEVLEDAHQLARWRRRHDGLTVGVVPTMGALHAGHGTLLRRARAECDAVLATLFVNPLQFGPTEDLDRYPRTFEADRALLAAAGTDALYAPRPADLYPEGFATYVVPEGPALGLEGAERPGHFRGVATVVYKLWCRTRPSRAYFGRKDAQQLAVLGRMVADLELDGTVVACPTVREPDGLALSSRNRYLSDAERARALGLSRALSTMAHEAAAGTRAADVLKDKGLRVLREADLDVDYLEIVDADTMRPQADVSAEPALAVATVRVGAARLLDNRWILVPDGAACP